MDEKKKKSWMSRLADYGAGCKGRLTASVILSAVSVAAGLIPFYCVYRLIDLLIQNQIAYSDIGIWCGAAVAAYFVKVLFFGFSTALSHNAAYHILEQLRLKVADRFLHAPLGSVQAYSIGEIKGVMVDKIESMEPPLAHMIPEGCGHLFLPLISFICLCLIDIRLALSALITVPFSFILMSITMKLSGKNFDKYNQSNAYMNSAIVEYIEGIEVIKAFGREGVSYEKFAKAITDYRIFVVKWLSDTWVTMKLSFALFPTTLLGTLPMCLFLGNSGSITEAEMVLGVMLSISMVTSLGVLEVFFDGIREMEYTIDDVEKFLNIPSLPEPEKNIELNNHGVKLNNVRFGYTENPEQEVLHGISLQLKEGSFTALVGPSGGGKSTVAKLISRFWDVTGGAITIGGVDIRNIPLRELADTVSFVTQDNFLFSTSLKENIRLGNPAATDEEVYAAARAAQCEEFIRKLPNGYDTPAGEAGSRLSGGEKQRIAIARMILKNAPVVILDEATAFTDPENEDKLQKSIGALTRGKTLLVIAHRLSTIAGADNIVVLKSGKIEAQGTQEELLKSCPLYQNMWKAHIGAKNWAVSGKGREEKAYV